MQIRDDSFIFCSKVLEEMNIKIPGFFAAIKDLPGMEHVNHNDLISLFKRRYTSQISFLFYFQLLAEEIIYLKF